jgi:STE24 endopeptidase
VEQTADFSRPDNEGLQKRAKKYNRIKRRLSLLHYLVDFLFLMAFLFSGFSLSLQRFFEGLGSNYWFVVGGYLIVFILLFETISFPVSFLSGYSLEHRYQLSIQSLRGWFIDKLKELLVSLSLGLVLGGLFYTILKEFPSFWWLISGGVFSLIFILMAKLFPVLLLPLFFRLTPVEDAELKKRLSSLLAKADTKLGGIYTIDFSKKTRKVNAALIGLGGTRKIILSDTLLERFTADEIEVILAHELGHHVFRHIPLLILIQSILTFVAFFIVDAVLKSGLAFFGFEAFHDIGNLPLFLLVFLVLGFVFLPFANSYSRRLERESDRYALVETGDREAFISSMEKLGALNLAEKDPHPLIEFLFHSHPSINKRIEFAKAFSERRKFAP